MVQEWLQGESTAPARFRVRIRLLQADFGSVAPLKSSKSQASKGIPGPDPSSRGELGPLLVLVVVSGPPSCGGDVGLLDPLKSPKCPISKGSLGPKSPFPGGSGPLLVLVVAGGAHSNLAICGPAGPPAQQA